MDSAMIRPQHPEHIAAEIIAGHDGNLELLDRLDGITELGTHLDVALADMRAVIISTKIGGQTAPLLTHVVARILDQMPGTPGGQNLEGTTSGGGTSDPTGTAAMIPAPHDLATLARAVERIARALDHICATGQTRRHDQVVRQHAKSIIRVVQVWQPRKASERDGAKLLDPDGCPSCSRVDVWSPPMADRPWRQGPLSESVYLCRPCRDHAGRHGEPPTLAELRHKKRWGKLPGRRVTPRRSA